MPKTVKLPQPGEWWVKKPCGKGACSMGWSLGATGEPVLIPHPSQSSYDWGTKFQVDCGCLYQVNAPEEEPVSEWIYRKSALQSLATKLGVRDDWHEPDEQGLEVQLTNGDFDNAMRDRSEAHIVLRQTDEEGNQREWRFNVADLFAMACESN